MYLPQQSYRQSRPLDRRLTCTTIIEDSPAQDSPQNALWTPRSRFPASPNTNSLPVSATGFDFGTQQAGNEGKDFDDLYDMTDNETEEISIRFSNTSMSEVPQSRKRFPSIVIPSPGHWPTVQKLQKHGASTLPMLSPALMSPQSIKSPSAASLAHFAAKKVHHSNSNVPSLDGSLTSDEMATLSCPSTPDMEAPAVREEDWTAPVTLQPNSLETLRRLTGSDNHVESQYVAVPVAEMEEIGPDCQEVPMDRLFTPVDDDDGQLSFLSVPSPGGFFAALEPSTRNTWGQAPEEQPSTSIAELFYGVPWNKTPTPTQTPAAPLASPPIVESNIYIEEDDNLTEGPPTARRIPLISPKYAPSVQTPRSIGGLLAAFPTVGRSSPEPIRDEVVENEYNEHYEQDVRSSGQVNLDRTSSWLASQTSYLEIPEEEPFMAPVDAVVPEERSISVDDHQGLATIEEEDEILPTPAFQQFSAPEKALPPRPDDRDTTFIRGFEHMKTTAQASDAFVLRKTRNDALRLDRACLFSSHVDRVEGKFEIADAPQTAIKRTTMELSTIEESTEEMEYVTAAQRERQALSQIQPVSWNLEATKYLNGGSLLMSPTGRTFQRKRNCRVLDLGGQATCDWAWQVAIEHPSVTVHTVHTEDHADAHIKGPENHKRQMVANLWTLPFPDNHFHLVSARNLYSQLRTLAPNGKTIDEYDLCLKECLRVLKPGGCLEFSLLDADIVHAGPQAQALSLEFAFDLRTRGYDPAPTKAFLPRLRKAGFGEVRRAWLVLPMAYHCLDEDFNPAHPEQGSTRDASFISGMVGSWAWERWMLKVQREMGWKEDRLLEGVTGALEEGSKTGGSWRFLSGYARKPRN